MSRLAVWVARCKISTEARGCHGAAACFVPGMGPGRGQESSRGACGCSGTFISAPRTGTLASSQS